MPKGFTLGKESRLSTPEQFRQVYQNARKFRFEGISLLACKNGLNHSRIAISIAKKQVSRAVDRNRIRRVIREYFRVHQKELPTNIDLICMVYSALSELSNFEITTCLEIPWTKLITFYKNV